MLVDRVITALQDRDEEALDRYGPVPAHMFELSRDPDPKTWSITSEEPYYDQLVGEPLPGAEIQRLRSALVAYVQAGAGAYGSSAIWALGKMFDPELRSFFVEVLERETAAREPAHELLGQCLIALDNLGEQAISGGSFSYLEDDKNLADAKQYLERLRGTGRI